MNHVLAASGPAFAWQRGYGYWSLGEKQCEAAVAYVRNQKDHHLAGTTNAWLERSDDEEETETRSAGSPHSLREAAAAYDIAVETPF